MTKVLLRGAGVIAGAGEREPAGVARQAQGRFEIEASLRSGSLGHLREAAGRKRRPALAHKHER
jgi:hypothetical protein